MTLQFTFYWPIMNAWIIVDFSLWMITMHTQCHRAQIYIFISVEMQLLDGCCQYLPAFSQKMGD